MLLNTPKIIPPELLMLLSEMGHGDELTIGDANFPAHAYSDKIIRMDGHGIPEILDAVLQLIPLDQYVENPVTLMEIPPTDDTKAPIWDEYAKVIEKHEERPDVIEHVERFAFYDKVRSGSRFVIMTGESALYANIIIRKGVIV